MLRIEVEEETDGRFIVEVPDLPGVMAYGQSRGEAIVKVEALALRVLAERVEHGEPVPGFPQIFSAAPSWVRSGKARERAFVSRFLGSERRNEAIAPYALSISPPWFRPRDCRVP